MAGLTERRGPDPSDSFWTWRRLMYRFLDRLTPEHVEAIAGLVQMEMLEAGYATNVEFHYLHHQPGGAPYANPAEMAGRIAAAAAETGIGLTLLPVHYQFGGCDRRPLGPGQDRFGTDPDVFARLHAASGDALKGLPADTRLGVAPHSLRAVAPEALPGLRTLGGPFHMHLAEQVAEVEEVRAARGLRPVEWVLEHMAPDAGCTFIHCTRMQPHETEGLARSGAVDVIVIDSVAALVPRAELEGDMGMATMGMQARLMSQALRKLAAILGKSKTMCLFTNQMREKVGVMFGSPETTPGGKALKFYASVRIDIRRREQLKDNMGNVIGNHIRTKVVKNKVSPPFMEAEFDIIYGQGINWEGDLIAVALARDVIQKKGAWLQFEGEMIGQGKEASRQALQDNPELAQKILAEITGEKAQEAPAANEEAEPAGEAEAPEPAKE